MLGIESALLDNLAADPGAPESGQLWFNVTDGVIRFFNGSATVSLPAGGSAPATQVGQVLSSCDGLTFAPELPVTNDFGWMVNDEGILIVNG